MTLAGLLLHCTPRLERANVPLLAGMRLDAGCSEAVFSENIKAFADAGLGEWLVAFVAYPEDEPAQAWAAFETQLIDSLLPLLQQQNQTYSLSFELLAPISPTLPLPAPDEWLSGMIPLLVKTQYFPPRRLVFMGAFVESAPAREALRASLAEIRAGSSPVFRGEIVYAAAPDLLDASFDWETPDLIGIRHRAPPDLDYRAYFRKTHQRLSRLLLAHQKPAIIVESNLIGEDHLLLFRNQLRFWNDSVDLRGIALNTLYCRMALTDSYSHFALAGQRELQRYLREYGK